MLKDTISDNQKEEYYNMRSLTKTKKKLFKAMIFILMIVMFITSYQFYKTMKHNAYVGLQTDFTLHAQEFKTLIEQRMLAYEHVLHGTRGLFFASDNISRSEFKAYIDTLMLSRIFPGIQGVGYAMVVPAEKKDKFIKETRSEGFSSFDITPATPRNFYTTIIYLEPFDARNKKAFGYDMFSNPKRRAAMEQSRDKSMAVISAKVTLLQENNTDVQSGFLMYLPIFENNTKNETIDERRKHILGWVYAPFRVNDLMHGLKNYESEDFDIEIYDDGVISQKTLMYDSYKSSKNPLFISKINLNIAGRDWTVLIKSTPSFEKKLDYAKATLVLVFGLIFNILLVYIVIQLINNEEDAKNKAKEMNTKLLIKRNQLADLNSNLEKKVEEKTYELQKSNDLLAKHVKDLEELNSRHIKAKEEAQQAAQARSNFISSISHELRTPLNAIINFTDQVIEDFDEMLENKGLQDEAKTFLGRVMVNSKHLLQLINDLLEFTKAEAGKMEYHIEPNDINEIVQASYINTYSLLNGTKVRYSINLDEKPLIAPVDFRRFLQIMLNLLSNAIKFTHKGFIEIRTFSKEDKIIVEIEDSGKGIPLEKQKNIFDPFIQVDSADYGTGLGLGLVKRMCEDMNIEITLFSEVSKGTVFRLTLQTKVDNK